VGEVAGDAGGEIERLTERRVERFSSTDPAALAARFRAGPVDEVILAGPLDPAVLRRLLTACAEAGLPALVPFDHGVHDLPPPGVEVVGHTPYLVYQRRRLDPPSLVLKAMLDRLLAAVLIVVLAPVLLALALLVRMFLGGPVLYVQQRAGLLGRPFPMLKFRSMRLGADREREALLAKNEMDGPVFKMTNDPRVTGLGRVLRRTSLDELPQLFNVLSGHMSLVGPRPLPIDETQALQGAHRRRLSMRPGLTCLWQVRGRSDLTFAEWMTLDLAYVDRWSLGLDLAILLRTIPAILVGRGAR
jgi:lipopolysaccharide/colanic/teichoic acid biosynthesis glycosyltransferase